MRHIGPISNSVQMLSQRRIVIGSLFILLAAGSTLLLQVTGKEESEKVKLEHTPDYYVEDFSVTNMDIDGKLEQTLSAERMLHYPDDDSTELTRPHLVIYEEGVPPWKIKSETGWVSGDGQLVLLNGAVKIDRIAAPGIRPVHITTRDLRVRPKENYAETDEKVKVRSLGDVQTSIGMQAWLDKPIRLKFLSKVRGHYEIN